MNEKTTNACRRRYYVANRDKVIAKAVAWNKANPEKLRENRKRWYELHRDETLAYQKEYRETHKAERRAYREANRERLRQYERGRYLISKLKKAAKNLYSNDVTR